MLERERSEEQALSEFWNGHGLWDHCDWLRIPLGTGIRKELDSIREFFVPSKLAESIGQRNLAQYCKRYYNSAIGKKPFVKRLGKEDSFRLEDYPMGTMVRFSHDRYDSKKGSNSNVFIGLVFQQKFGDNFSDIVISVSEEDNGEIFFKFTHDINMGEVTHLRIKGHPHLLSRTETLERFNWMDIIGYGRGIRARANESRVPQLSPKINEPIV